MEEKIDRILAEVGEIKSRMAVYDEKFHSCNARMKKTEENIDRVKESQSKMVGGFMVISAIFTAIGVAFLKLFK